MNRWLLKGVLVLLQHLLIRVSHKDANYRAALSKNVCIRLAANDGVCVDFMVRDRYFIDGEADTPADFALQFSNSTQALLFLIARDPLSRLIDGLARNQVALTGSIMLLVWFQGRIQEALPWARFNKHQVKLPGSRLVPLMDSKTRHKVERYPAIEHLDPVWHAAIEAREKVLMYQVGHGQTAPKF